jgi:hypothetical protein
MSVDNSRCVEVNPNEVMVYSLDDAVQNLAVYCF